MVKDQIVEIINTALTKSGFDAESVTITNPSSESFGDYTTTIALRLGKKLKKDPFYIAETIAQNIAVKDPIEQVKIIRPGFINIYLSKKYLTDTLKEIVSNDSFGTSDSLKNKKIMCEFTDPNPFKEMHIGHLYSNTIGESLSRLLISQGADVKRVNYQGDVGMHVAKSIWGLKKKMTEENISIEDLEKTPLTERVKYLGAAYAKGATAYEEDKSAAEEMKTINYLVFESAQKMLVKEQNWEPQVDYKQYIKKSNWDQEEVYKLYTHGRKWSLDYFETIYKRLGTKFDYYYFESIVGEFGIKIVKEYLEKGVFEKSDGAVIFNGEKYGLHTRVFINSLGLPTYEAKELGLAPTKYKQFPYDEAIIITGNEIKEYFKVLVTALKQINKELGEKTTHISHGMVRLPEGKMSSRTGKVLTAEWLLDEVKNKVRTLVEKSVKVEKNIVEDVSEKLTIAAIKYSFLKNSIGKDISFDFNESLSLEGNSGPYLEYTYARCLSVLSRHSEANGVQPKNPELTGSFANAQDDILLNNDESSLIRHLAKFAEVVQNAARSYSPNYIATYLFDTAQKYNLFYQKNPILKAEENKKNIRLFITKATAQVIKNGLHLLGIQVVEKM